MNKQIDKLAWLYLKEGKLLVARSKNKAAFYVPGGKREVGESDEQALIREIKEELSVNLRPETIKYAQTFTAQADGKGDDVEVKLTCYFADFEGELVAAAEIEAFDFINYQSQNAKTSSSPATCSLATRVAMDWLKEKGLLS